MINNFAEFLDYCLDFYGVNGIYPENKRTKEQIAYATLMHLDMCASEHVTDYTWGDGDSLDRERVRDIMNRLFPNLDKPVTPKALSFFS